MPQKSKKRLLRNPRMSDSVVMLDGQTRKERYDMTLEQVRDYVLNDVLRITRETGTEFVTFSQLIKAVKNARVAQLNEASVGQLAEPLEVENNPITTFTLKEEQELFKTDEPIRVVNPITFDQVDFTASANQVGKTVFVESKNIERRFPAGSFVFLNPVGVNLGIIAGLSAIQLFAQSTAIGVITQAVDGVVDQLPVNLWGFVSAGDTINLFPEVIPSNYTGGKITQKYATIRSAGGATKYDMGLQNLPIMEQTLRLPEGTFFGLNGVTLSSRFHVDPGQIKAVVERNIQANSLGELYQDRPSGIASSIQITKIEEAITLLDGQILKLENEKGESENIVINGEQTIGPIGDFSQVTFVEKELQYDYFKGFAWLFEAAYKMTGRLTIETNRINANVLAINDTNTALAQAEIDLQAYTDGKVATAMATVYTKAEIDGQMATAKSTWESYADDQIAFAMATVYTKAEVDGQFASAQTTWQSYTDGEVSTAKIEMQAYTDNELSSAMATVYTKSETDGEISTAIVGFEARVTTGDVDIVAGINATADTINGARIKITGDTTFQGNVTVNADFSMQSSDFSEANKLGWKLVSGASSKLIVNKVIQMDGIDIDTTDFLVPRLLNATASGVWNSGSTGTDYSVSWSLTSTVLSTDRLEVKYYRNGALVHVKSGITPASTPNSQFVGGGSSGQDVFVIVSLYRSISGADNVISTITTREEPQLI